MKLVWVCVGGALGSGARFLVTTWSLQRYGPAFPYGTLAVNIAGSFLLALLFQLSRSVTWLSPTLQMALGAGFMGGFTTYSTFNLELVQYAQNGQTRLAATYGAATLVGCLCAGFVGMHLGRLPSPR
ncbi:fluoride efflux transporter CrcB [Polyangium spumosum]|uniref:Fluoride-specific ion channel FluC n=1 Tax=Polyangium spumosum TaxID=889282 RepID=A0A6N7PU56_9BACT|nr:fluoride efflux transporter CrcB [Polyangium spumosum]MRG95523.1 fluoride efflux transporter CrcB [Polyangium spumosum]